VIDLQTFQLFLVTCGLLVITPGPDTLFVVARSIERGRLVGVVSAIGICSGFLVHTFAAVVGVSALLMSSAIAFNAVKYLGAAYLLYLGIRTLASPAQPLRASGETPAALWRIFWQGLMTNVLNPKVALFFLAFIPQFVDPSQGSVIAQIAILGVTDMLLCLVWLSMLALVTGTTRQWLVDQPRFWRAQKWVTGGLFTVLGARLLLVERSV
jgi:threonine/homoserine/homoserine lactone efflux protein